MLAAFALEAWRHRENVSQGELAQKLFVTQAYVSMLLAGKRAPGRRLRADIEDLTQGHVPANTWPTWEQIKARKKRKRKVRYA